MRDTKALIAAAAAGEFARYGFHGARTERIARGAGVNKQLIFYYFGSKVGLYRSVVESAASRLAVAVRTFAGATDRATPGSERVRRWVEALFLVAEADSPLARLVLHGLEGPDDAAGVAEEFFRNLTAELAGEISTGQGLGYFRDDVDPGLVAVQAVAQVFGFFALGAGRDTGPAEEHRARWAQATAGAVARTLSW